MIRHSVSGLALLALASGAYAADARLLTREYNDEKVVLIEGRAGVQATITFDDGEQIENVAIGDANLWQVTPNKRADLLFVKPLAARARTNLTVVTDRRSYFFDLVASPTSRPIYALRFTYPNHTKRVVDGQKLSMVVAPIESRVAPIAEKAPDPAQFNFDWRVRGKGPLVPSRIYDDGSFTYLTWPTGTPIPAMLVRDANGQEGPVNFAMRGDVVVIDEVPDLLVLRVGGSSAILENSRRKSKSGRRGAPLAKVSARSTRRPGAQEQR